MDCWDKPGNDKLVSQWQSPTPAGRRNSSQIPPPTFFVATFFAWVLSSRRVIAGLLRENSVRRTGRLAAIMLSLVKDSGPIVPSGATTY